MALFKAVRRLLCLAGRHRRDRARARADGSLHVSPCIGCGRRMVKRRHGWRVERSAPLDWDRNHS